MEASLFLAELQKTASRPWITSCRGLLKSLWLRICMVRSGGFAISTERSRSYAPASPWFGSVRTYLRTPNPSLPSHMGCTWGVPFLAPAWRPPRHPTSPPFLLYDLEVGNYYYGQGHPMKSYRIRMTQALLAHYGLLHNMQVYKPNPARERDLCRFHSDDYIGFLRSVTPETQQDQIRALKRFNVGEDCPVFDGLFNFPEFLWFSRRCSLCKSANNWCCRV